jgi:hypothetical protein
VAEATPTALTTSAASGAAGMAVVPPRAPGPTGTRDPARSTGTPVLPVEAPIIATTTSPAVPAAAAGGWLTIGRASYWADVYVDGRLVGRRGQGPASSWVASKQSPLGLSSGEHRLALKNPQSFPWEQTITVVPGETLVIDDVQLKRLPVTFVVNPKLPRECKLEVDGVAYGPIKDSTSFKLAEPLPGTEVVFDCPEPIGTFTQTIGSTAGGDSVVIPTNIPGSVPG